MTKSLWLLPAIVGLVALLACGEATSPTASTSPDLEATVEARVQATIGAPIPTTTPELEATVTPRVEATRETHPTATTTVTLTSTPLPTVTPAFTATPLPTSAPSPAAMYYNQGLVHFINEDYDDAIANFDKVIEIDSEYADAYFRRGYAHYRNKNDVKAMADADEAIRLNPDHANAYSLRGWLNVEKDYKKAIAYYDKAIDMQLADTDTYYFRGAANYLKKNYDIAITDFNEAIRLNPNYVRAYTNRGLSFYSKGHYDRAISDFNEAIKGLPDFETAYYLRGLSYYALGEHDRAIDDLEKVIELNPDNANAFDDLEVIGKWNCDRLSESIEELSEEKAAGTSRSEILKIYGIQETYRSPTYVDCSGLARLSSGPDEDIVFYVEKDEDGDQFYGYEFKTNTSTPVPNNTTNQSSEVASDRKYELTSSQKEGFFQIKATRQIPLHGIREGDLGGFVRGEFNLSHDGEAWIFADAIVKDSARIQGNAAVHGIVEAEARVEGNAAVYGIVKGAARVTGNAVVFGVVGGQAQVFDAAVVYGIVEGNAKVFGNAVVTGIVTGDTSVSE